MTIAAQDLELIKRELSGIREFYDARIDTEIPPLKEEMDRISGQLNKVQEMWRDGEKRALLSRFGGSDRWTEPHRLLAKMEFAPTEFAQEIASLYRSGFQWGVPVGFKPLRYEERRDEKTGAFLGLRFLEQELLEVSAVPVSYEHNGETPVDIGRWTHQSWE